MPASRWDGGKWICGMRNILQRNDCVIYSFGSNGDTTFEQAVLNGTRCEVFTFDPTLNADQEALVKSVAGLQFYPWGLVSRDEANKEGSQAHGTMHSLEQIMKMLNHTWVDVLKLDIEGYENAVLQEFAGNVPPVTQLLVELHIFPSFNSYPKDVAATLMAVRQAGFKVFRKEPNNLWPHECYEFAMIRTDNHGYALLPESARHRGLQLHQESITASASTEHH